MWHMLYITTESDYAKRDSHLAAYEGVVLQRFEFIKACIPTNTRTHSLIYDYYLSRSYRPFRPRLFEFRLESRNQWYLLEKDI